MSKTWLHLRRAHLRLPRLSPEVIPDEELCVRLVTLQSPCIFSHGGSDVIRALSVLAWLGVLAKQRAPSVDAIISTRWHALPKIYRRPEASYRIAGMEWPALSKSRPVR